MKHARLVSGEYPNAWDKNAMDHVANDDGTVNWGAAFRADPGVKKCPGCGEYYWDEASVMECTTCKAQFGNGLSVGKTGE